MDDPQQLEDLLLQSTGIWVGQRVEGEVPVPLTWNLTITPNTPYPSVFGASKTDNNIISEKGCGPGLQRYQYLGTIQGNGDADSNLVIVGAWKLEGTETGGTFVLVKEPADDSVHISGVWVGEATPSPDLANFFIPTNPIRWSISIEKNTGELYGSGYFDDSGDMPGQSVLFYRISGSCQKDNTINVTKVYEYSDQTAGTVVSYSGQLEQTADGCFWLKGKWDNPTGSCYGTFTCRRQPPDLLSPHMCLCSLCDKILRPGETRWGCDHCFSFGSYCSDCQTTDQVKSHQHTLVPETVFGVTAASGSTCSQLILNSFKKFAERPLLGTKIGSEFIYSSYAQVFEKVLDVVFGLRTLGIKPGDFVLFCSDISISSVITMIAVVIQGCVVVPIHGILEEDSISQIISRTNPVLCFADSKYSSKISHLKKTVTFDGEGEQSITSLMEKGNKNPERTSDFIPYKRNPEDILAILYTSGSTGLPKGAIFSEELCLPTEGIAVIYPFIRLDFQPFDPSLILSLLSSLQCGGSRALATDVSTLLQDMGIARPTHMGATPAFWNSLYHAFRLNVNKILKVTGNQTGRTEIENQVGKELRASLGNRLLVASCGGAPISEHVLEFVRRHLKIDIVNLYGSRETGGITRDGKIYSGVDVHLLSLPELGYTTDSDPPQGEICVYSPRLIPGYYGDQETTQNSFVMIDGKKYYRTGDVGEMQLKGTTRYLRIIDRTKFVLKLSQGEWISPNKIELVIEDSIWVKQAFVTGDPTQSVLVVIVVPSKLMLDYFPADDEQRNAKIETKLLQEVRFWCRHNHLRPIEIPQSLHVEFQEWNSANSMFTSTEKKNRIGLFNKYRSVVQHLYSLLQPESADEVPQVSGVSAEFQEMILSIIPGTSFSRDVTFHELGADSLATARLVNLLKQSGYHISIQDLYEYPLGHLSNILQAQKDGSYFFEKGTQDKINWKKEMKLPDFKNLPKIQKSTEKSAILLTGATGFLGTVLLFNLLRNTKDVDVFCVVRGKSVEHSSVRLEKDLVTSLLDFSELRPRIKVLCGDLEKTNLGLSDDQVKEVLSVITHIYHNGAAVKMTVPYEQLKATNVNGTIEVIKFAIQSGAHLSYVSSVAALPAGAYTEEEMPQITPSDMINKGGYGQSKVVSEQLVYSSSLEYGVSVKIFRPCAISGSTSNSFSNPTDYTNILLSAIVHLGCAPEKNTFLNWIPVDFVAESIVKISLENSITQKVFHLVGDGGPSMTELHKVLCKSIGKEIPYVPGPVWMDRVRGLESSHPGYPVKHLLENLNPAPKSNLPNPHTVKALVQLGIKIPELNPEIIEGYFKYFLKTGFIKVT